MVAALPQAALNAASQMMRFAMLVKQPAPIASTVTNGKMGVMYDMWLTQLIQTSTAVSSSVDQLHSLLPSNQMQKSFKSIMTLCRAIQDSLEGSLQYDSGARKSSNGIVWTSQPIEQTWLKAHARRLHRAVAMELFLVQLFKLEYALLLAHTSDSHAATTLLGAKFEAEYKESMQQLHAYMSADQPNLDGFYNDMRDTEGADWLLDRLDNQDVTRDWMNTFLMYHGGAVQRFMHRNARDYVWAQWRGFAGGGAGLAAGIAGMFAGGAGAVHANAQVLNLRQRFIQRVAEEIVNDPAGAPVAAPAALEIAANYAGMLFAGGPGGPLAAVSHWNDGDRDHFERFWYRIMTNDIHALYRFWRQTRRSFEHQTPAPPIPPAAVGFGGFGGLPIATAAHVAQTRNLVRDHILRRMRGSLLLVRQRAFHAILDLTSSYSNIVPPTFANQILMRSGEYFVELMGLFDSAHNISLGFRNQWTGKEVREHLASLLRKDTEYTCVMYRNPVAVPGQFIMRRLRNNVNITQRDVVHEWSREKGGGARHAINEEEQILWGVVHSSPNLLADLIHLLAPVVLGNLSVRSNSLAPIKEIHCLLTRAVCRFDLMQTDDGGRVDQYERANPYFFSHAAGVAAGGGFNFPVTPPRAVCDTLKTGLEEEPPVVGTVEHTTQPVNENYKKWLIKINELWETANGQARGGAGVDLFPVHCSFRDLLVNCLLGRSLKAIPVGKPENPMDALETENVVWRRRMPLMLWTLCKTWPQATADDMYLRNVIMSLHSFNSLFVIHMAAAVGELQKTFETQPTLFVLNGNNQNEIVCTVGGAAALHTLDMNTAFGLVTGPSLQWLIHTFLMGGAAGGPGINLNFTYPTIRKTAERAQELADELQAKYKAKTAPSTWPMHWLLSAAAPIPANQSFDLLVDHVTLDAGATLLNFAALGVPPVVLPAAGTSDAAAHAIVVLEYR